MIPELAPVVLTADLPDLGLERGDIGTVVLVHRGGEAYEVEFVTLDGQTIDVVTLDQGQVRPVSNREVAHARPVPSRSTP